MFAFLKILVFLVIVGITWWIIWANTDPAPDEPCDYKYCSVCPFPCERHKNKIG